MNSPTIPDFASIVLAVLSHGFFEWGTGEAE